MAIRTDLRNSIITALKTVAAFESRVYTGRRRSLPRANLPACCVYVEQEEKELASTGSPRTFRRELTVVYEIYSSDTAGDYTELDTLCKACETALMSDETLGGNALGILPLSDAYEISEEGDPSGTFSECRAMVEYID